MMARTSNACRGSTGANPADEWGKVYLFYGPFPGPAAE